MTRQDTMDSRLEGAPSDVLFRKRDFSSFMAAPGETSYTKRSPTGNSMHPPHGRDNSMGFFSALPYPVKGNKLL